MAANDGERRMVFDIRGKRRNVVKVVYGILALLMGTSLFLVIGPFNIASLFEDKNALNAASGLEDQAKTLEVKLKKDPQDPQLLLNLTRTRISAGNTLVVSNPETGAIAYTPESREQLNLASEAWSKYLKSTDEPSASGAQLASGALFGLAQTSTTGPEALANIRAAARAQEIVAETRPSIGSISTLATYQLFSFDYKGAEQSRQEAAKFANTKFERESLENELDQTEKRAREFQAQVTEAEKEAQKAREAGGKPNLGKELSGNPFGP
jgi:hypothetical protein